MFRKVWVVVRAVLATVGAATMLATFSPVATWWTRWLTGNRWDVPFGDTLIVLGGSPPVGDGKFLSYSSYWRSVSAARAWRIARFRQILVTGDDGNAESMADYLRSQGVPAEALRLETRSTNTQENAKNAAAMLSGTDPGRVALLTSDFHMRRASAVFEKAGFRNFIVLPVPDAGKRNISLLLRWQVCLDLAEETAKYVGYRFLGRL